MRRLLVMIFLLNGYAEAADFRASVLGQSCERIIEQETALAAEPIPWRQPNPNIHAFKGTVFGREASIVYLCCNGELCTGNYFFGKQTKDAALQTLRVTYDALVSEYGVPFLDSSPWQYGASTTDPRLIGETPQHYSTSWQTPRVNVTAALMLSGDETGPSWEVMVVFGKNPDLTKSSSGRSKTPTSEH